MLPTDLTFFGMRDPLSLVVLAQADPTPSAIPELITTFLDVCKELFKFARETMVPASITEVDLIHIAIWVPIVLGLVTLAVSVFRGLFNKRARMA